MAELSVTVTFMMLEPGYITFERTFVFSLTVFEIKLLR